MKYEFSITGNQGYGYDQVRGMKVGDLKAILEDLEDDDELFLHDTGNRFGADWHSFVLPMHTLEEIYEDEEEEDD